MGLSTFQRILFLMYEYNKLKEVLKTQVENMLGHTVIGISDIEIDKDKELIVAYYDYFDDDYDFWDRKSYDKHTLSDCCIIRMDELNNF